MAQTTHLPTPITDALELKMETDGKRDVPVRVYQQMRVFESDRAELLAALEWTVGFIDTYARQAAMPATPELNKARAAIAKATQ